MDHPFTMEVLYMYFVVILLVAVCSQIEVLVHAKAYLATITYIASLILIQSGSTILNLYIEHVPTIGFWYSITKAWHQYSQVFGQTKISKIHSHVLHN